MKWQGRWIWLANEPDSQINLRVLARKTFNINIGNLGEFNRAELAISADTAYRLFINGKWVNDGPVRGFPWKYSFDRIEVGKFLRPGKNVLAVWVQHHGEGTFHQLATRPGLLAQLEIGNGNEKSRQVIATDATWKLCEDPAHFRWTPRISCQMPCEEQYDAQDEMSGWSNAEFNDSAWPRAKVVATVEDGPWQNLTERDIPLLAVDRINPIRIAAARKVQAPNFIETLSLKRALWPERVDANQRTYRAAVLTAIRSPAAQDAAIFKTNTGVWDARLFLNGKPVNYDSGKIKLNKGSNILLAVFDCAHHYDEFSLILDVKKMVTLKSPVCKGAWAVAGPFEQENEDWARVKESKTLDRLKQKNVLRLFCEPPYPSVLGPDAFALCTTQRPLPGSPKVRTLENLLADNDELAVIEAQKEDVEIMIDMGCEYNAHVEFDLSAPPGVMIDAHCFEDIVDDKPKYTCGNRSGFRYITRDGWQKYTTYRHFGFRYLILTFRNLTGPVTIRNLAALFVHQQVEHKGSFQCNDYLLNKIWDVGKQTLLCCMEDTFTDCPTYEQTYWVGDGRNEALVSHMAFGNYDITRRCSRLPAWSLKRSDLTESQVPSGWQNILPAWSFLWVQMVWEQFYFAGDTAILRELYPAIAKMMNNIRKKYLEPKTGLFSIQAWNMFDWTKVDDQHNLVTHNNLFLAGALQTTVRIAQALGLKAQARDWQKWTTDLTDRINKYLWSEKRQAYIDSIHNDGTPSLSISRPTNTLALLYDIAPPNRAKKIQPLVLGEKTKDIVPFGSPFALFYLLEYFAKSGRFDKLTDLVREEWGFMVDQGATAFWETLRKTRSNCHAWSAAPTYFLSRYVLGVHPEGPGFEKVLFQPNILDLKFAKGSVPIPGGNINVSWERTRSEFKMEIEKPVNLSGRLQLPPELKIAALKINGRPAKLGLLPRTPKILVEAKLK
jgi:alpha-L-rhamnosidase